MEIIDRNSLDLIDTYPRWAMRFGKTCPDCCQPYTCTIQHRLWSRSQYEALDDRSSSLHHRSTIHYRVEKETRKKKWKPTFNRHVFQSNVKKIKKKTVHIEELERLFKKLIVIGARPTTCHDANSFFVSFISHACIVRAHYILKEEIFHFPVPI